MNKTALRRLSASRLTPAAPRTPSRSDAHDPKHRSPNLDKARQAILARWGRRRAEILFTENPSNIIEDLPGESTTRTWNQLTADAQVVDRP
jgi:hypothetical protein